MYCIIITRPYYAILLQIFLQRKMFKIPLFSLVFVVLLFSFIIQSMSIFSSFNCRDVKNCLKDCCFVFLDNLPYNKNEDDDSVDSMEDIKLDELVVEKHSDSDQVLRSRKERQEVNFTKNQQLKDWKINIPQSNKQISNKELNQNLKDQVRLKSEELVIGSIDPVIESIEPVIESAKPVIESSQPVKETKIFINEQVKSLNNLPILDNKPVLVFPGKKPETETTRKEFKDEADEDWVVLE